jgi:hypothetical protein
MLFEHAACTNPHGKGQAHLPKPARTGPVREHGVVRYAPTFGEDMVSEVQGSEEAAAKPQCSRAARCRPSSGAACGSSNVGALSTVC